MLTLFLGAKQRFQIRPKKTLQMNEAQNRPGAAAQLRTVKCGGEKSIERCFFLSASYFSL